MRSSRFIGHLTATLGAQQRRVLAPVRVRGGASGRDVDGSVEVGVFDEAAGCTHEARLVLAAFGVDGIASRAGLRGIGGIDLHERPATLFELVGKQRFEGVPALIEDGAASQTSSCTRT